MYVYGGSGNDHSVYNDLWRYNSKTKKWKRLSPSGTIPTPRLFPTLNHYSCINEDTGAHETYLILFGGVQIDQKLKIRDGLEPVMYRYNIITNRWSKVFQRKREVKACQHSAIVIGDEMIVMNGYRLIDGVAPPKDTVLVFNFESKTWTTENSAYLNRYGPINGGMSFSHLYNFNKFTNVLLGENVISNLFQIDCHHILYIWGKTALPRTRSAIEIYLLSRPFCNDSACDICEHEEEEEPGKHSDEEDSDEEDNSRPKKEVTWTIERIKIDNDESMNAVFSGPFCMVSFLSFLYILHNLFSADQKLYCISNHETSEK